MSGTVLVLPSSLPLHASDVGALLNGNYPARVVTPSTGDGPVTARICIAIAVMAPSPPLTIVAFGDACERLPAVAFAQRSAHRRVDEYVLVDPVLPAVTESWPDTRVTVFTHDDTGEVASVCRLRGWTVASTDALASWTPEWS